jgi:hypothetical protein
MSFRGKNSHALFEIRNICSAGLLQVAINSSGALEVQGTCSESMSIGFAEKGEHRVMMGVSSERLALIHPNEASTWGCGLLNNTAKRTIAHRGSDTNFSNTSV